MAPPSLLWADSYASNVAVSATGTLAAFNRAGVLTAADVHVARRVAALGGEPDDAVTLAAALAVRAPRLGHVYVDLDTVRHTAADEDDELDLSALPWPDTADWITRLARSGMVSAGESGPDDRPLRLIGKSLYLDRYWRDERGVADALLDRAGESVAAVDEATLAAGLSRLFPDGAEEPRWAAATAVLRRLSVIAGGPGSGKTTTLARVVALIDEQADELADERAGRPPLVGLAAPTGKAAARLEEAVHAEALDLDVAPPVRRHLLSLRASTVHRLLGVRPDSASRFRHHRHHRLPHDVIIVDETSMVALSLMARLVDAVRPDARLILVGDPEQLASVEAGAALGDIVGPALERPRMTHAAGERLRRLTGTAPLPASADAPGLGDNIVVLRANYRFRGALAALAAAVRSGDADQAVRLLSAGDDSLRWVEVDDVVDRSPATASPALQPIRDMATSAGGALFGEAADGNGDAAVDALAGFRVLCAHRHGPSGVSTWTSRIEDWLAASLPEFAPGGAWYLGRPVMVTTNDYSLRLFNGDTGVVIARGDGGVAVAFRRAGSLVTISPARLSAVDTVFAMTVHKAQGSEFRQVAVVLPAPPSAVLTRQLLYTAITRAQEGVVVVASEAAVRTAVGRPIARASGLTGWLWGPDGGR
jgi:exodeoxyribonuclease V alpha subunit